MEKNPLSSKEGQLSCRDLAARTKSKLESIELPEETKKEIKRRRSDQLLGAERNINFIKSVISPIFLDQHQGVEAGLIIDFGLRPVFSPQHEDKFIMYDGIKLFLCLLKGHGEKDFEILSEIKEGKDVQTLCQRQGKEGRRALLAFGKMSKAEIITRVINAVELLSQDPAKPNSSFTNLVEPPDINIERENFIRKAVKLIVRRSEDN